MGKQRICHICGTVCTDACPTCTAAFKHRRDATTMTAEERAVELESLVGVLEIDFDKLHQRITELVGRDVWTHELAHPENLVAEIRRGVPASIGDVLDQFAEHFHDKPIIVVSTD